MNYIITGLPRSRTAWLAAAVGTPQYPCLHEGLVLGVDGLKSWMVNHPGAGDSDSGLPLYWRHLDFPYRLVIVRRRIGDAIESYRRVTGFDHVVATLAILNLSEAINEWAAAVDHLSVDYEDLSDNATVIRIIDYVHEGKIGHQGGKSDIVRLSVLQELQIEQRALKLLGKSPMS
jgi:hypothetical protein